MGSWPLDPHPKNFNISAVSLLLLRNSMFTFHNYTTQMKQKIACKCLIVHSTMLCDSLHLHYLYIALYNFDGHKLFKPYEYILCYVQYVLLSIQVTVVTGINDKIVKIQFLIRKLQNERKWSLIADTDYGRPMKPFFIETQNFLDRQVGQIIFGTFGAFLSDLSAPILVL